MTDLGKITEHGGRLRKSTLGFNNFLDRFSLPAPLDFLNGFRHHTRKRTVLQENKPTRMGLSILDTSWTPPERFLERDLQGWTLLGYEIRRLSVGIEPTGTMPKPLTTSKKNRRYIYKKNIFFFNSFSMNSLDRVKPYIRNRILSFFMIIDCVTERYGIKY